MWNKNLFEDLQIPCVQGTPSLPVTLENPCTFAEGRERMDGWIIDWMSECSIAGLLDLFNSSID